MTFFKKMNEHGNGTIRSWIGNTSMGLLMGVIASAALFAPAMLLADEMDTHPMDGVLIICPADDEPDCVEEMSDDEQLRRDIDRAVLIAIFGQDGVDA